MGYGQHEKDDPENPQSDEDEQAAERRKLNEQEGIELKKLPPQSRTDGPRPAILIAGQTKPFVKTSHLKYALLCFNCILAILGLAILILAIWIRTDPEFRQYDIKLDIKTFYQVCNMLIVAGLIILVIAFLGCFAVFSESQVLLTIYFIVYTLIFILQLVAMIMVFTTPYSPKLKGILESEMKAQVENARLDDASRFFMDFLQENLQCCGAKSARDYDGDTTPHSCDDPNTGALYKSGCAASMVDFLRSRGGIIGGIAAVILLLQLFSLIVCFCLIHNIKKERMYSI